MQVKSLVPKSRGCSSLGLGRAGAGARSPGVSSLGHITDAFVPSGNLAGLSPRATIMSLEDFEQRLNQAIERNAFLVIPRFPKPCESPVLAHSSLLRGSTSPVFEEDIVSSTPQDTVYLSQV